MYVKILRSACLLTFCVPFFVSFGSAATKIWAPGALQSPYLLKHNNLPISKTNKIDVSGRVLDENGAGLPGVSVKIKGTNIGTVTDNNGNFSLKNVDDNATLIIVYVGYKPQEVNVNAKTTLIIRLTPENNDLTEVVVVGFGTQKKVSVTAAIATITNKQLLQTPVVNISNALVGRMPGLVAQQTSGQPGVDGSTLIIRGRATLNNASPLILIDGVERPLNSISAYEVESVSILKDASATAVYGVRGANGVLLVTTKRGIEGKAKISVTYTAALQEITRIAKFLNSYDYAVLMNEALANEGKTPIYNQTALDAYKNHSDPFLYPDVDLMEEFLKPFAAQHVFNANATGGSRFFKYFVSGGYLYQGGLFKHIKDRPVGADIDYSRFNFRSNVDIDVSKDFLLKVNLAARSETTNIPNFGIQPLFSTLMRVPPNAMPLLNPDGTYGAGVNITDNTLARFAEYGFTREYANLMEGTVEGRYSLGALVKGLSLNSKLAFTNHYKQRIDRFKTDYARYVLTGKDANGNYTYGARIGNDQPIYNFSQSFVSDANNSYREVYFEGALNYQNTFGKNNVSGLVLFNRSRKTLNRAATATVPDWPFSYQGVVARLTYDYNDRYLAEVNMGYNGSEQFPDGAKYGLFPSVSAGWVISNESFLKDNKTISFLKLRGSYGQVGNDKIDGGTRFLYLDNPYTSSGGYAFGLTNNINPGGILEGAFGNKFIKWEKANKSNIALESKFLKNRIAFNLDVFYEKRSNILVIPGTIPANVGTALPVVNLGIVENKGYEIELNYQDAVGTFNYFINTNLSYAVNKLLYRDEPEAKYPWMRDTGKPLGMNRGLQTAGFFNSQAEIDSWAKSAYDPGPLGKIQPGDFKYIDQNGDGIIDDFDRVQLRNPTLPRYILGLNFGANYKGFDFTAGFQGADQASMLVNLEAAYEFFNLGKVMDIHLGRWTPATAATATYPRLSSSSGSGHNYQQNDYWVKDARYIRLKQAELGYTFSSNWLKRVKMNALRVYFNGSNLYTWSKIKYLDPENRNTRAWNYPQQRVWSMGANVTF